MVMCLGRGANDLHMVQLMPLPPNISCSSKIENGLPFWCRFTQVVLEKRPLNGCSSSIYFCVTVFLCMSNIYVDSNLPLSCGNMYDVIQYIL